MNKRTLVASTLAALGLAVSAPAWAAHHEKLDDMFKGADKDSDGTLDREEAKALPMVSRQFDRLDGDKDGTVSLEEVRAGMKMGKKKMKHMKNMHEEGQKMFGRADKDADGTLDREEAKAMPRVAKHFDEIDTDKDGTVSMDEIHTFMKDHHGMHGKDGMHGGGMHDRGGKMFAAADKDNDGTLDREEAKAMPRVAKHFDEIDADKDGTVSLDEIHTFMKDHHKDGMHHGKHHEDMGDAHEDHDHDGHDDDGDDD